ncbi:hypothetical protein HRM2_33960 [Desulforapulum autotrophicum HRM2]|uniref:Uncharacterized protein n=1 Tax=Desulforapulum autotrophicum (strain ATCC 43914 / DSM 3382 / VKM B-1955 / HRM2) TaxID=177437 RepID=C0QMF4_DESAH|nr:hypothetical protein HRM2_33960 [Desulforapulum autotrophicum HRM2]
MLNPVAGSAGWFSPPDGWKTGLSYGRPVLSCLLRCLNGHIFQYAPLKRLEYDLKSYAMFWKILFRAWALSMSDGSVWGIYSYLQQDFSIMTFAFFQLPTSGMIVRLKLSRNKIRFESKES